MEDLCNLILFSGHMRCGTAHCPAHLSNYGCHCTYQNTPGENTDPLDRYHTHTQTHTHTHTPPHTHTHTHCTGSNHTYTLTPTDTLLEKKACLKLVMIWECVAELPG